MKIFRIFLWLLILPALFVGYLIVTPITLNLFGYFPNYIGSDAAEYIASHSKDPKDCLKIVHTISHPFSPSQSEQRSNCLYLVGHKLNDPTACEFLMPSRYGLNCIGEIVAKIADPVMCNIVENNNIICFDEKDTKYVNPDCSAFEKDSMMRDRCLGEFGEKNSDPALCKEISNQKLKEGCEIYIKYSRVL